MSKKNKIIRHRTKQEKKSTTIPSFLFCKNNYKWLLGGLGLIMLGYILMMGGGSNNPDVFNPAIFNFRRIRLAPLIILLGFATQVYAILKPKCK